MALTKTPVCDFGKKAENFKLKSINKEVITLSDIKGEKATLIMFICNHCPYVKAVTKDIVEDCKKLKDIGINSVAICANDAENYAMEVIKSDMEEAGDEDVIRKVKGDLGNLATDEEIRAKLNECYGKAMDDLAA